jgi:hypothetical protein
LHIPLAHIENGCSNRQRLVILDFAFHKFQEYDIFSGSMR